MADAPSSRIVRYFVGFVLAVAFVTLPRSVRAQDVAAPSKAEEPPALKCPEPLSPYCIQTEGGDVTCYCWLGPSPWLRLELDSSGWALMPLMYEPPVQEQLRVKRARIALGVSAVPLFLGTIIAAAGASRTIRGIGGPSDDPPEGEGGLIAGAAMLGVGAVGMITSGIILGVRKRQLREAEGTTKKELRSAKRESRSQDTGEAKETSSGPERSYEKRLPR